MKITNYVIDVINHIIIISASKSNFFILNAEKNWNYSASMCYTFYTYVLAHE